MKLEDRKVELEKEFSALEEEAKKLNQEGAVINRKLSELKTRQIQLQGAYAEVERLLKKEEPKKDKQLEIKK